MALSVVFTAAYWFSGSNKGSPFYSIGHIGVVSPEDIWNGHYSAMLTCIFYHGDLFHIIFNMMWTWRLGAAIERELSPLAYLGFLVGGAIIASGVQIGLTGVPGIGMSGVGYAMFGLIWGGRGNSIEWRSLASKDNRNLFIGWGVLCIITTYLNILPVANGAHFGGLLFGLCIGYLFFAPRRRPLYWIPMAIMAVLTVTGIRWVPWSSAWQWWAGNREYRSHHYASAVDHYRWSIKLGDHDPGLLENIVLGTSAEYYEALGRNDVKAMERLSHELDTAQKQWDVVKPVGTPEKGQKQQSDGDSSDQ